MMHALKTVWVVAWNAFYYGTLTWTLVSLSRWGYRLWQAPTPRTRHAWYTPSAWLSSFLLEIAAHAPNEPGMVVAALYGLVEVCGAKRLMGTLWQHRLLLYALLRRKRQP